MTRILDRNSRYFLAFGIVLLSFGPALAAGTGCFQDNHTAAIVACDTALADTDILTPSKAAQYRRARAEHLVETSAFTAALADLDLLSDFDQTLETHHLLRARALLGLSRQQEALAAVSTGLGYTPLHVPSLIFRARLLIAADDPEAAIADAGLAATLAPENPEPNIVMAAALEAVGAKEAAKRSTEAAQAVPETVPEFEPEPDPSTDPVTTAQNSQEPSALELTFWNDVKNSGSTGEIEAFLAAFPNSVFAPLAKLRLQKLGGGSNSTDAPETTARPIKPVVQIHPTIPFDLVHGSQGDSLVWSVIQLPGGDLIAAGGIGNSANSDSDPWIARINRQGNIVWENTRPGTGEASITSVIQLENGNLMVAELSKASNDLVDITLKSFGLDGEVLWSKSMGQTSDYLRFVGLTALKSGGAIATTATGVGKSVNQDTRIVRLSEKGDIIWDRQYPEPDADFGLRALDAGNGIFVLGDVSPANADGQIARLQRLDYDGNLIWQKVFDAENKQIGMGMTVLPGGDLVLTGMTSQDDNNSIWLARITADSVPVWQTILDFGDRDDALAVTVTPKGEIVVAGSSGTPDNSNIRAGWVVWLDQQGRTIARKILGDNEEEYIVDITALADGGLAIGGNVRPIGADKSRLRIFTLAARENIAPAAFLPENNALVKACSALTAHPEDVQRLNLLTRVNWDDLDGHAAKSECSIAVGAFPDHPQTLYQNGRLHHKLDEFVTALDFYEKAAAAGYIRAMAGAAIILTAGPETLKNEHKAAQYFQQAVDLNDATAAGELASLYWYGTGVQKDQRRSAELYVMAAEGGQLFAQYRAAQVYNNGWGVNADYDKAFKWYSKAAERDHPNAIFQLAYFYRYGLATKEDRAKAQRLYAKAAELGDPEAMQEMGRAYEFGENVTQNYTKAANWYRKAAAEGQAEAKASLGFLYELGLGVVADEPKALELYRAAAEADNAQGLYQMGRVYDDGFMVTRDTTVAANYFKRAVAKEYGSAYSKLAFYYRDGVAVEKDEKRAYELFKQAADWKYTIGLREAGWLKYLGRGTSKDMNGAINLISQAADKTDGLANIYLAFIYETEKQFYNFETAARYYYEGLRLGETYPVNRAHRDWDRNTARALQRHLKNAGYYNGALDGQIGQGTVAAMKAFCQCE